MVIPNWFWATSEHRNHHVVLTFEVGIVPERRWTNPKGVTNQTKNAGIPSSFVVAVVGGGFVVGGGVFLLLLLLLL